MPLEASRGDSQAKDIMPAKSAKNNPIFALYKFSLLIKKMHKDKISGNLDIIYLGDISLPALYFL